MIQAHCVYHCIPVVSWAMRPAPHKPRIITPSATLRNAEKKAAGCERADPSDDR
eukprot:gene10443-2638_t